VTFWSGSGPSFGQIDKPPQGGGGGKLAKGKKIRRERLSQGNLVKPSNTVQMREVWKKTSFMSFGIKAYPNLFGDSIFRLLENIGARKEGIRGGPGEN